MDTTYLYSYIVVSTPTAMNISIKKSYLLLYLTTVSMSYTELLVAISSLLRVISADSLPVLDHIVFLNGNQPGRFKSKVTVIAKKDNAVVEGLSGTPSAHQSTIQSKISARTAYSKL